MTKKELQSILKVLKHIKNPDGFVKEALYNVERDINRYENMKGQLHDYELDNYNW